MRILFLTNYQKTIPPFALNELKFAHAFFDKVVYVNPKLKHDNRSEMQRDNISYYIGRSFDFFLGFFRFLLLAFSKTSFSNIAYGLKKKKFSPRFLLNHWHKLYDAAVLGIILRRAYRKNKGDTNVFLSCWFDSSALAFCFFKPDNNYSNRFYSFAHSYEVDSSKNSLVGFGFDKQIVDRVNKVFFISRSILDKYLHNEFIIGLFTDQISKFGIRYLGVENHFDVTFKSSDRFKILSCSTVIPVKRLDVIVDCLACSEKPIEWVHIGDGPEFSKLQKTAAAKLDGKTNVKYTFLGSLPNREVIRYLHEEPIDLFVNVSSSEGIPVSIMEAISFGIPVVATNVGGTGEIVNSDVGRLISGLCEPQELLAAIESIYSLDRDARQLLFANCRRKWSQLFNLEKNASSFYNEL